MARGDDRPALDHVALRVPDRDEAVRELVSELDVHVIEQTDRFTLVGADAHHGKLTLLDAEDGAWPLPSRIVSLVLAETGDATPPPRTMLGGVVVTFAPQGERTEVPRHALVGIGLRVVDPPISAAQLEGIHGMRVGAVTPDLAVLQVGGRGPEDGQLTLSRERWSEELGPSMLDHVGIRVPDAEEWRTRIEAAEVDVVRWIEAPHSRAVFVAGPEGLLLEYVEQTAAFATS